MCAVAPRQAPDCDAPAARRAGRRVVLGVGNILNHDEGVGVEVVRALAARLATEPTGDEPAGAANGTPPELIDGGVLGFELLPIIESCSHLLILDAIDGGRPPGSVMELRDDDVPRASSQKVSMHQVTMHDLLALACVRGFLPAHVVVLGVQPADLALGVGLSPEVVSAVPAVVTRALEIVSGWSRQE